MRRRDFIRLLGGAAVLRPLATRAQQPTMPVVGFLSTGIAGMAAAAVSLNAFRRGLGETGYVEGRNLAIEYRWADEIYDRLPELFADLVRLRVSVIAATGGSASFFAGKATTIPVVFSGGGDPVAAGLVASLNRPGGNFTGATFFSGELGPKRLDLLRQVVPTVTVIAVLLNPSNPNFESLSKNLEAAARRLGLELQVRRGSTDGDIDALFETLTRLHAGALLIGPDNFLFSRNEHIAALALRFGVPTMYQWREFADAGGLMSYGPSQTDVYRQVGIYTGRILKGEKPADLPVVQSTKIELVINLRSAKALGLTVPPSVLVAADEVIE
jgi:putative ABC transport system substrate-binding protein